MQKRFVNYSVGLVLLLMTFGLNASGQISNTIHWMRGIPQASYFNPSLTPDANLYIGIPGLSSHFSSMSNSGFALRDFLRKDSQGNLFWDEDNLLNSLKNRNMLDGAVSHEMIAIGWRKGPNYYSISASENFTGSFAYSRDFLTLMVKGNDYFLQQERISDLSGTAMDAMHYRQLAFGMARQWETGFSAGVRAKALFGMSNVWFERTDMTLVTQQENYGLMLNADILVNTSLPFSLSPIDSLGSDSDFDFDGRDYIFNARNLGFALDVGVSWKLENNLTLAASIVDLGFINWRSGVENFSMLGNFEFNGIDPNDYSDDESEDYVNNLLDSIRDIFDIAEFSRTYYTPLTGKAFLSAGLQLHPQHSLGALIRGEIYRGTIYPGYTLSYNYKPIPAFAVSLAWSIIRNSYQNLGAGMHVNMGPVQLYLAGDNFFGFMQPHTLQAASVHFGLNLVFGYKPEKKAELPIYSW